MSLTKQREPILYDDLPDLVSLSNRQFKYPKPFASHGNPDAQNLVRHTVGITSAAVRELNPTQSHSVERMAALSRLQGGLCQLTGLTQREILCGVLAGAKRGAFNPTDRRIVIYGSAVIEDPTPRMHETDAAAAQLRLVNKLRQSSTGINSLGLSRDDRLVLNELGEQGVMTLREGLKDKLDASDPLSLSRLTALEKLLEATDEGDPDVFNKVALGLAASVGEEGFVAHRRPVTITRARGEHMVELGAELIDL